ncbi:pre-peptidase C-terminal domain-containing protein [Synechococcus sp. EJ6-Ellesmere]|uniref:pre-peptidase C-terminal domain-containing protein n=1 Tax=Synechococcus sp. EJ6-Ellesmere TaxID=2823734 RepID=UPI0020CF3E0D|nr:pre-peptidase C-terminal domain-containing protein [Synechococcus sp. EJ6-Ellesmere]MCP9826154.1 DUF11 domain-containing protein [Synechococcus sp. EJ6-Ellesmere]
MLYFDSDKDIMLAGGTYAFDQVLNLVLIELRQSLCSFAASPEFIDNMRLAFGESFPPEAALSLALDWAKGDVTLPPIEILPSAILNGAYGGYASARNTIYLSEDLLRENKLSLTTSIVLEEFGHSLDSLLNDSDTPGDEGQIFAGLLQGISLPESKLQALMQENDFTTIYIEGQEVQIEQAVISGDGGQGGTTQTIALESQGLNLVKFRWENFTIEDEFQIQYEGKRIAGDVGLQSGGGSGERIVAKNNSNELTVKVTAPLEGTAWNFDVETVPLEINISGLLGDIIEVDIVNELTKRGISLQQAGLPPNGFGLQSNTNNRGKIAEIDNRQTELQKGKFYFVPTVNGVIRQLNQARTDNGIGESTLVVTNGNVEIPIKFNIQDGYNEAVTFGTKKLDVYRQQQRLAYFSFPDNSGNPLEVDGATGSATRWATQLFNIAVDQRLLSNRGRIPAQSKALKSYINASNAPEWRDLRGITNFDFPPASNEFRRFFGISWSGAVIQGGTNAFGGNLDSSGVAQQNGSGFPSSSHDGGRGIDIESPGQEIYRNRKGGYTIDHRHLFFQEREIDGTWYVATAQTLTIKDPIIINNNGTYQAGDATNAADLARGLTTNSLVANARTILPQISNLLVDNTAVGYSLQNAENIIDAFGGQGVGAILFNDPRTWDNGAQYSGSHWGHIHVEVADLVQRNSLPSPLNIPSAQNFSSNTFAISSSTPLLEAIDLGAFEATQNLTGVIDSNNLEQYYRFVLGNPVNEAEIEGEYFVTVRDFSLLLDGLSSNVDVELIRDYNEDGIRQDDEVIFSSQETGNSAESLNLTDLPEEVYYIRVFQQEEDTDYNLTLTILPLPVPPDNAGNTTLQAADLGTLNGNLQRSDFIGQVDPDDYYGFNLSTITDININVDVLEFGDIFLILGRDDNNDGVIKFDEALALSDAESSGAENISVTGLTPGEYYIWLSRNSGGTQYNLNVSATPSVIPLDIAGNTPSAAFDFGSLNTASNFSDFVGNVDPDDFYRFTLESVSGLRIELDGLSADADLELAQDTNNDGVIDFDEIFSSSELSGTDVEIIEYSALAAGTYFVRVLQYEGDSNYNLSLTPTVPVGSDLSVIRSGPTGAVDLGQQYTYTLTVTNNGPSIANNVFLTENLPSGVSVVDASASGFDLQSNLVDIYEFQLNAGERVTLDIDAQSVGSSLDSVLRLFNSAGDEIAFSDDNAAPDEDDISFDSYIDFTASIASTYYVGVSGYDNFSYNPLVYDSSFLDYEQGSYSLEIIVGDGGSVNQVFLGDPGNILSEAFDTGLSSATPGTFISTSSIRGSTNPVDVSNGVVTANLGTLNSGQSATVNLTLSTFISGDLLSTVVVTGDEPEYNLLNNSLVSSKTVNSITSPDADLELTQVVDNSNPEIGDQITFTLTLANQGPGTATAIKVEDILPTGVSYASSLAELGSYDSNTGIWSVGNMPPNQSVSLSITATVVSGPSITNTAEVTAVDEGDPDSTPNNNNPGEDDQSSILVNVQNTGQTNEGPASFTINGTYQVGQGLLAVATSPDPDGDGTFSYLWESSSNGTIWTGIGSNSSSLLLTTNEADRQVRLTVSYSDGDGFNESVLVPGGTVQPNIVDDGDAGFSIIGTALVGEILTATEVTPDPDGAPPAGYSYQWQSSSDGTTWSPIGSNASTYAVTAAEQGKQVRVLVSYIDGKGFQEEVQASVSIIDPDAPLAPTLELAADTGLSPFDGITANGAVLVAGLATGASWQYSADGGTSWIDGVGTSFRLTGSGARSVIARQENQSGKVSPPSAPLDFILDNNAGLILSEGFAQLIYVAYYGRPADPGGLGFWNDALGRNNVSYAPRLGDGLTGGEAGIYEQIINQFGNSSEATRLYAGLTNQQLVDQVYQFCFSRNAEVDSIIGKNYWVDQLDQGNISLAELAVEVSLAAQGEDIVVLSNKIRSANSFTDAIDTPVELNAYGGEPARLFGISYLDAFGETAAGNELGILALDQFLSGSEAFMPGSMI